MASRKVDYSPEAWERHKERERTRKAEKRADPEERARQNADRAEYQRKRWASDPEFRKRKKRQHQPQEVRRAHVAVRLAVRAGRLVRPDTCSWCGGPGPIEAAHTDYSRRLDVTWLCRSCHRRWDAAEPKQAKQAG